jgi:hypothetical protein
MSVSAPGSGIELRVRRSVDDLSPLDLARLRRAFQAMMAVDDDRGYQHLAGIHGLPLPMYGRHGQLSFLPWNRIYLARFEAALREFEPGVVLPWWDWSGGEGIPGVFAQAEIEGQSNPLHSSPIDSTNWPEDGSPYPSESSRELSRLEDLPSWSLLLETLASEDFEDFAPQLEQIHNALHGWIGGTNSSIPYAFYDPFCWVYQATFDRVWSLWQDRHPSVGPPDGLGEQGLSPFNVSVDDVWSAAQLGYAYAGPQSTTSSVFLAGAAGDRPSVADQLNFSDYAQAFAEIIASENTTPPLTIGIYGSWGIGKSSLLEMIAGQFEQPDAGPTPVHVVEFNAWEYNSSEAIWPALVRRVMEEMERRATWTWRARLWDTIKRNVDREWRRRRAPLAVGFVSVLLVAILAAIELNFSPALIAAALGALGIFGIAKLISDVATNPISKWVAGLAERDAYGEELPYMREVRADLRFLADQMRRDGEQPRILVTVDDLDRCEPEKAVEVLQAVNQLLDFDAFIVCLGIDARVITAAVEAHYKQLLGEAGASGYEYLDKIVQIPFRIPTPTPTEIEAFLLAQMPVRFGGPEVEIEVVPSPAGDGAPADYDEPEAGSGAGAAQDEPVDSESAPSVPTLFELEEVDGFRELAPYIRSNPRHIKRLINVYRMVRTLAIRRGVDDILENSALTIAWIVICAQWPYTVNGMLRAMKPYVESVDTGGAYPVGAPLSLLHAKAEDELDGGLRRKLDGDLDDLRKLLDRTEVTWEQLRVLQAYTLNFNPAIEEALHRSQRAPVLGSLKY